MAKTADEKGRKVPPPSAGGTHLHRGNAEVHDIEATPPNHPFANHIAPAGRLESHYSAHQEPPTSRRTWMIRPRPTYIERLSANRWFVQSRAQGFVPTRARLDTSGTAGAQGRGPARRSVEGAGTNVTRPEARSNDSTGTASHISGATTHAGWRDWSRPESTSTRCWPVLQRAVRPFSVRAIGRRGGARRAWPVGP